MRYFLVILILSLGFWTISCTPSKVYIVGQDAAPVRLEAGKVFTPPANGYFLTDKYLDDIIKNMIRARQRIQDLEEELMDQPKTSTERLDLDSYIGLPSFSS